MSSPATAPETNPRWPSFVGWIAIILAAISLLLALLGTPWLWELSAWATFVSWTSLAVTLFAVYLATLIYRKQTDESARAVGNQIELLSAISAHSSSAARSSHNAHENTEKILGFLRRALLQKNRALPPELSEIIESSLDFDSISGARLLWVDDNLDWIDLERSAIESAGVVTIWVSHTSAALDLLEGNRFDVIVTDMGRHEGPREGYVLLEAVRRADKDTPVVVYSSSRKPEHVAEVLAAGGQGATNDPTELFQLVMEQLSASR